MLLNSVGFRQQTRDGRRFDRAHLPRSRPFLPSAGESFILFLYFFYGIVLRVTCHRKRLLPVCGSVSCSTSGVRRLLHWCAPGVWETSRSQEPGTLIIITSILLFISVFTRRPMSVD